ncbi:hypothetical protein EJ06DRAFT_542895 [Trichodelitschia bisporula]|uniref:laccase n=1 Tax=Trichodelitschia bisporula TaxID=703511 RepID=A0A6G1HY42_9PEZI|nr:hypothetical protein EJ06DRAFT_542895 [Trichodelitschia bisporula]
MHLSGLAVAGLLTLVNSALCSELQTPTSSTSATATPKTDSNCANGPLTRGCWGNGFSISTDFDTKWPTTGRTVSYNFEITNTTCSPDGSGAKICMLVNGQYPGPTIYANWGDMISVTVKNSLHDNGTSIHWHGIRQLNSNPQDGVNGITECPLAPGDTKQYLFQATQYGTTWYHSHYSSQYGDGLVGAIVINGPAVANYDIDMGPYVISDWYYQPVFRLEEIVNTNLQSASPPPPGDNILINGTNKNADGSTGQYNTVQLTKGKKHRLRLINTSVDNQIRVSLDGHPFTVISSDLVPIHSFTANWLLLGVGQRYDVIITANQTGGNFWFRAEVAGDCFSANNGVGRSIFTYAGSAVATPNTNAAAQPAVCQDEGPLVPWWPTNVPSDAFNSQVRDLEVDINVEQLTTNGQNIVVWAVNLTAIDVDWRDPTLQYVVQGNSSYPHVYNLVELPTEGIWTYWVIQETSGTPVPIPHPIHLHGHDFFILGAKSGAIFNKDTDAASLNFANPPRRDVTFLPAGGWVVIAFPTDNPGAWLMHCHIAWHISEGLGVQFLESKSTIKLPDATWQKTCANWNAYYSGNPAYLKTDSGL